MPYSSDPLRLAKSLLEGMWAGDLNDLISNDISIDEYESKVDDKAMVVGFFVKDIDAAGDLNRYIQKSTVDLLYSEVSPAPDQRGYYIVFVEFLDNTQLAKNICDLVEEVTMLTNVEEWHASVFGLDKKIKVSLESISAALSKAHKKDEEKAREDRHQREVTLTTKLSDLKKKLEAARRRLSESSLDDVLISNGGLILTSRKSKREFDVEHVGPLDSLDIGAISLDFGDLRECRELVTNLGEGWDVGKTGRSFILHALDTDVVIVVTPR